VLVPNSDSGSGSSIFQVSDNHRMIGDHKSPTCWRRWGDHIFFHRRNGGPEKNVVNVGTELFIMFILGSWPLKESNLIHVLQYADFCRSCLRQFWTQDVSTAELVNWLFGNDADTSKRMCNHTR
jgi:hypothetical protein